MSWWRRILLRFARWLADKAASAEPGLLEREAEERVWKRVTASVPKIERKPIVPGGTVHERLPIPRERRHADLALYGGEFAEPDEKAAAEQHAAYCEGLVNDVERLEAMRGQLTTAQIERFLNNGRNL